MLADIVGRHPELRVLESFLDRLGEGPAGLVLEGEPGIGKTTLLRAATEGAGGRGHRVLACRPAAAEAQLSYAGIADLLADVDLGLVKGLPEPQHRSLEVALVRRAAAGGAADQRAVAAALLTVLRVLGEGCPVLLAVDDYQWLDRPSRQAIEFAARRLGGPVGLLLSVRTGEDAVVAPPRLPDPDRLERLRIGPLSAGALHHLLRERTGRAFPRRLLARILERSGGNPFFALELARALEPDSSWEAADRLPETLSDLVGARIQALDEDVRECLLVAATLAEPRVEILERVVGGRGRASLERAEEQRVIEIGEGRVRFTHPLLAGAVYGAAPATRRRALHRRLAGVVDASEERARHLALGATWADPETVAALDRAADQAQARGAPAAAAELLELALRLGDHDPARRIRLAQHLLDGGDSDRARALLEEVVAELGPSRDRAEALLHLGTIHGHGHDYAEAAALLERARGEASGDRLLRAQIALFQGVVEVDLGRGEEAHERATAAVADAERAGDRGLLAQTLAVRVLTRFFRGQGLDEADLARALALEDSNRRLAVVRPTVVAGWLRTWSGSLDDARTLLLSARRRCLERGEETDVLTFAYHTVQLECFRGDFESARRIADDATARAELLGTEGRRAIALAAVGTASAYLGRVDEARRAAEEALALFQRTSFAGGALWPLGTLGFLDISLGATEAAAERLGPMAEQAASMGLAEPMVTPFAADAAEALVGAGRLGEAAAVVDGLEGCGRRTDRAWALAVGARCRALLLAAQGDLAAAVAGAERALSEHERLPMPFERARTLLVAGQLQRRSRRRTAAGGLLEEALGTFERLRAPLWARRARAELERLGVRRGAAGELTPSERRVAELAAQGLTNRDVAARLFMSPKTVEANLARVYRKLEIRSRAELGRLVSEGRLAADRRETPDAGEMPAGR